MLTVNTILTIDGLSSIRGFSATQENEETNKKTMKPFVLGSVDYLPLLLVKEL